jgi:homogentisate 1,2-dioxygenase
MLNLRIAMREVSMIHFQKGRVARQAHVGIPEGLYEEEHGRKGFAGRASQLYHLHPPTRW